MKPVMKNDSAVSEIIGAILLFAIASVLLTSFILWYVPSTGTNNDITYQSQTQQSFSSLDSKLLSPSLTPGSSISQSMPLGISGVPPFSPSQSTNLYYNKNFNATMSYKADVTYENAVPIKNVTTVACANSTAGDIRNNIYASSQFTYSVIFAESGLPSIYYWTVSLGGVEKAQGATGTTSYITFSLPRGTYSYSISTNGLNFTSNPSSGTVNVNTSVNTIGLTFSKGDVAGIVAGAYGPSEEINNVNQANFVRQVTSYSTTPSTQTLNYWLNNSTNGMYRLSSQQFFVYSNGTPVNCYNFLVEPNFVYYSQESQGNAYIISSIGNKPWGGNISTTVRSNTINQTQITNPPYKNDLVTVNLNSITTLNSGTYYLNVWEAVNESSPYNPPNSYYNSNCSSYGLSFQQSLGTPNLYVNNPNPGTESAYGYGYGPNEFIGTITNPSTNLGVGNSYYYSASIKSQGYGRYITFGPFASYKYQFTGFTMSGEKLIQGSTPYFFKVGYNQSSSPSVLKYKLNISEMNLPVGMTWNITINNKLYNNTTTSNGGNKISVNLPAGIYSYQVSKAGSFLSNRSNGFIDITASGPNQLFLSFFQPVGSLPNSWETSNFASQQFIVSGNKPQLINFVSLYFFNYTIGPESHNGSNLDYSVCINILNATTLNPVAGDNASLIYNVSQTGWAQIFFNKGSGFELNPGVYEIFVSDIGGQNNAIGMGFTTTGGYSNYFQRVCSNFLSRSINDVKQAQLTPYYGGSGSSLRVINTSFIFQIGFYNVTKSEVINHLIIIKNFKIIGSVEATGNTQFSIQETYALQDGIIITAGKGVTYVTVNPLPISLSSTSNGTIALSSIGYNMSMARSVATSISGYGSTILSATMENQTSQSYTVNNSCVISSVFAKVMNIKLLDYKYSINSTFSKYWANTFFVELVGSSQNENYTNFSVFKQFNFLLNGNTETVSINQPVNLSTINLKTVSIEINSM